MSLPIQREFGVENEASPKRCNAKGNEIAKDPGHAGKLCEEIEDLAGDERDNGEGQQSPYTDPLVSGWPDPFFRGSIFHARSITAEKVMGIEADGLQGVTMVSSSVRRWLSTGFQSEWNIERWNAGKSNQ